MNPQPNIVSIRTPSCPAGPPHFDSELHAQECTDSLHIVRRNLRKKTTFFKIQILSGNMDVNLTY